jgi:hypothetical protein
MPKTVGQALQIRLNLLSYLADMFTLLTRITLFALDLDMVETSYLVTALALFIALRVERKTNAVPPETTSKERSSTNGRGLVLLLRYSWLFIK